MKFEIGRNAETGQPLLVDLDRLIETRMLVQANSGAGKSWTLRRLLEQTHGHVQQIVIDVEDEFHSLRERFDYVLAGRHGGDCPADVRSAELLARRLLELGVSAIVGIFELKHHDRLRFVRLFLDALVNAPRELWHPALVVVDEAHVFCPEKGEAESASAVIDLATRGRKRGFCAVLATQRLAKLAKDAAAECNNKLIGRSALDVDMKRAGDELGFTTKGDQLRLRDLPDGRFFAFGPAISGQIVEVNIGAVQTRHPRAGERALPPPPPREKVKQVLAQLADLPAEAEKQQKSIAELQATVRTLERELRQAKAATPAPVIDENALAAAEQRGYGAGFRDARKDHAASLRIVSDAILGHMETTKATVSAFIAEKSKEVAADLAKVPVPANTGLYRALPQPAAPARAKAENNEKLTLAERKVLTVLTRYPHGKNLKETGALAGYAYKGGGFNNAVYSLRTHGYIEGGKDLLRITEDGSAALGHVEPLPTGRELYEYWRGQLGQAESEVLRVLYESGVRALTKEEIAAQTISAKGEPYEPNGGGFNNAIYRLRNLELIAGTGELRASAVLFDCAL